MQASSDLDANNDEVRSVGGFRLAAHLAARAQGGGDARSVRRRSSERARRRGGGSSSARNPELGMRMRVASQSPVCAVVPRNPGLEMRMRVALEGTGGAEMDFRRFRVVPRLGSAKEHLFRSGTMICGNVRIGFVLRFETGGSSCLI